MKKCPLTFKKLDGVVMHINTSAPCIGDECAAYREREHEITNTINYKTDKLIEWKCMMFPQGEWQEVANERDTKVDR